jgi:hypothetical protein
MVYLDLIMRSVTDPGLMQIMIKFLLDDEKFDEQRIMDVLIERVNSPDSRVRFDLQKYQARDDNLKFFHSFAW